MAEWDTFASNEAFIAWSTRWIEQAARVLRPAGSLYIFGRSEKLAFLLPPAMAFFTSCRWLVWSYTTKGNMGCDWGRAHESILHLRKSDDFTFNADDVRIPYGEHTLRYPDHPTGSMSRYGKAGAKGLWTPHPKGAKARDVIEIATISNGMSQKTPHPTQKPEELIRKLVLASSNKGDLVLDPFIGSGTTAVVAEQLGRRWLGCDNDRTCIGWAIERIKKVEHRTVPERYRSGSPSTVRMMSAAEGCARVVAACRGAGKSVSGAALAGECAGRAACGAGPSSDCDRSPISRK